MAQYKASMERIERLEIDGTNEEGQNLLAVNGTKGAEDQFESDYIVIHQPSNPFLSWLEAHTGFIMMPILPLLWCALFIATMDRQSLLSAWAMPLLGICSASLANAVPVGGGIVFVPVLALFGFQIQLGTAFAVSTMTFGNGVFGFLSWLRKDPGSIAWGTVPYAVLPAWIGSLYGTYNLFMTPAESRHLFALFCVLVAAVVGWGLYRNGGADEKGVFSLVDDARTGTDRTPSKALVATLSSAAAGTVLVPHIGIGNAMTTFLVCTFVWRLPAKTSVVTGILVGGWTSAVPFAIHLFVIGDVPLNLWVMGLPGVYIGAQIAPIVHEWLGIATVLTAFVIFLLGTAVLMVFT